MIRTSIILPPTLYQRLILQAKHDGKPLSEFVRDVLDRSVAERERPQIDKMYSTLKELDSIVKSPVSNASSTIDEVLYGENGAWRGNIANSNEE